MDSFYEQLVEAKETTAYKVINVLFYVFAVITILIFSINFIIAAISLIASVACFFGKRKMYVEYEYAFTNGDIDVDAIIEKKKRKKMLSFNIKDVELLTAEDSDFVKDFSGKPEKVTNCYVNGSNDRIYVAMITGGNDRQQLKFAPDKKFIDLCFKYNPRAVKREMY